MSREHTMRSGRLQRGTTLLEAMIAMGVLMLGAAGLVGLQRQSNFFMGDSRRTTRASMFAQDLVNQIELWSYDDPRLANRTTSNDADLGDSAEAMAISVDPVADNLADFGEASLGSTWAGMPRELLDINQMERYWNVADAPDSNGNNVVDGKRVAVIVRWRAGASWRRMVFVVTKVNTGDML
jgi:Tfp pilus assembly protein PilV